MLRLFSTTCLIAICFIWPRHSLGQNNLIPNPTFEFNPGVKCVYCTISNNTQSKNVSWWTPIIGNFRYADARYNPFSFMVLSTCLNPDFPDDPPCLPIQYNFGGGSNQPLLPYAGENCIGFAFDASHDTTKPGGGWTPSNLYREYAATQLTQALEAEQVYHFSMFFQTKGRSANWEASVACFDILFSEDSLQFDWYEYYISGVYYEVYSSYIKNYNHELYHADLPVQLRYEGAAFPIDSGATAWNRLSGYFRAKGGEKHVTIGCFRQPFTFDRYMYTIPGSDEHLRFFTSNLSYMANAIDSISLVKWEQQPTGPLPGSGNDYTNRPVRIENNYKPPVPPSPAPLKIPNVITPNGDGLNDYWVIDGLPEGSAVVIHNRWGNTVFSEAPYRHRFNAEGLEAGTYFYLITEPNGTFHKGPLRVIKE